MLARRYRYPADSPVITLAADESGPTGSLSSRVDLLEDKAGSLDIESVSRPPASTGFVAATPETTNVGFSSSAWWVRFTLRNASNQPRLMYLRQSYPLIDSLDLFEPESAADGAGTPPETGARSARATSRSATSCSR